MEVGGRTASPQAFVPGLVAGNVTTKRVRVVRKSTGCRPCSLQRGASYCSHCHHLVSRHIRTLLLVCANPGTLGNPAMYSIDELPRFPSSSLWPCRRRGCCTYRNLRCQIGNRGVLNSLVFLGDHGGRRVLHQHDRFPGVDAINCSVVIAEPTDGVDFTEGTVHRANITPAERDREVGGVVGSLVKAREAEHLSGLLRTVVSSLVKVSPRQVDHAGCDVRPSDGDPDCEPDDLGAGELEALTFS